MLLAGFLLFDETASANSGACGMAKAFSERPRWQRWAMIGGWGFLGIVLLGTLLGEPADSGKSAAPQPADLAGVRAEYARLALPCEAAQAAVGAGLADLANADRVALAGSVRRMEDACGSAWLGLGDITLPEGLTGEQEDQAEAFVAQCKTAFWLRKELAEKLMPVVDGDFRPSVVAALQADMDEMRREASRCSSVFEAFAPVPAAPASTE
jgi:hypothetical protein